jgi:hypothetical protein
MCRSYFESRYHAYYGIFWYFVSFVILWTILAIWAFSIVDDKAMSKSNAASRCSNLNLFADTMGLSGAIEVVLSGMLAGAFMTLMNGVGFAYFAVISLILYGVHMLCKTIVVMMGVVWIYGSSQSYCKATVPSVFNNVSIFFLVTLGVLTFQYVVGTFILLSCGLHYAVHEAYYHIRGQDTGKDDFLDGQSVSGFN